MLVVGIGGSAGGLEALQAMLRGLSHPPDAAFVAVFDLDAGAHERLLASLPAGGPLPFAVARNGVKLERGHVYVIPAQTKASIADGAIRLADVERRDKRRTAIDHLFQSLADDQKQRAVAILLSGVGSDGALGLKAVSDAGGMTIVQEPASAEHDGMVQSALDTGAVDHVLAPEAVAREIQAYAAHLSTTKNEKALHDELLFVLPQICDALLKATGHNFKHYKTTTLLRRTLRRLHVLRLAAAREYLELVRADQAEAQRLFQDLLVSVTAFFRDQEPFASLTANVIPKIFKGRRPGEPVRIWVAGCATGEEAYTLAMLVREHMDGLAAPPQVQIFATDIDEHALSVARQGVYPIGIADELTPERLKRFFVKRGEHYHATKELREVCVFSHHNLINDPPFSRLDLISCRNLLIYLGSHLQQKLMPLFHFALRPGGFLFLGTSENVKDHQELFRPIDAKHRISQRLPTAIQTGGFPTGGHRGSAVKPPNAPTAEELDLYLVMQRIILDEFAPKAAIVDEAGKVLCAAGNLEKYLTVAEGVFQNNIVKLARRGLRVALRAALAEAAKLRRKVVRSGVTLRTKHRAEQIQLTVQPMPQLGEDVGTFLVAFADLPPGAPVVPLGEGSAAHPEAAAIIDQLERDLETTRADLEKTVQDLEAANEELKSSNEELLSMNEELQSANEELQTSRDEGQAINESLTRANDDLENLLSSTQIATIFLDHQHHIRRVAAAANEIYNIRRDDVNRPLSDITHRAKLMPPMPTREEVLAASAPIEHEIDLVNGRTYLRRIVAYTTQGRVPEGTVVTFIDITERRKIERKLQESEALYRAIGESIDYGVWVCDPDGRNIYASESFLELIGMTMEQCRDFGWGIILHPDDRDATLAAWIECVRTGANWDREHRVLGADGKYHAVLARGVPVRDADGAVVYWAGINLDVSAQKRSEDILRESEERFRVLADSAPVLIWVHGLEGCEYVNREYLEFVGDTQEGVRAMRWTKALLPEDAPDYLSTYRVAFERRERFEAIARLRRHDGEYRWTQSVGLPRFSDSGQFLGYVGSTFDITEIKRAQDALIDVDRRKDEFLAMLAHELRNPLGAIVNANLVASRPQVDSQTRVWSHQVIERQARQLTRLVDDLLDLSRISSGKVRLQKQPVDAVQVLEKAIEVAERTIEQKNQRLTLEVSADALPVDADPARLEQIFVNLLSNANKYTPEGGSIAVTAAREDNYAVFRVTDTGRGIPSDMLTQIFEAFTQVDDTLDRAQSGLGLGLTVVKHLIEEHGGYVRARSDGLGKGSTFTLGIPLRSREAANTGYGEKSARLAPGAPRTILLIEDHTDNAQTLATLLQHAGHTVHVSHDGRDAVALAERLKPEVVLLDLGLPGMDGYQIAAALRETDAAADALIVAISGYGQQRDRDRSRAATIDHHFVKPVELGALLALLATEPETQSDYSLSQ